MADKTFHSIKFPGLPDTYKIPDIVNEYSTSSAYAVGDYVLKDGKTYKCTTAIASSGEAWNTAHWTEVKVGNDLQGEVADLKSAFDGLESDLKGESEDEITFVYDYYINVGNVSTVNINSPVSDNRYKYAIVDCSEGDKFLINAYGGNAPRAYCFIDSNNSKLRISDADTNIINQTIVAPPNSAKLIINDRQTESGDLSSYKLSEIGDLFVRFDKEQNKTNEEKAIARKNIGIDSIEINNIRFTEPESGYVVIGWNGSSPVDNSYIIMELGYIDGSGNNMDDRDNRIRTKDYIPVTGGSTLSITGCPFAESWLDYGGLYEDNSVVVVFGGRYYDESKNVLGMFVMDSSGNIPQVSLPSNAKYIRFWFQRGLYYKYESGFSRYAIYPIVINGTEYHLKEVNDYGYIQKTEPYIKMELGNIDANGNNAANNVYRIRTKDYIPVTGGSTLSITGCPFAYSWLVYSELSNGNNCISVLGVRVYDESKTFLSLHNIISGSTGDVSSISLPQSAKYIRFIMQRDSVFVYQSGFSKLATRPLLINDTSYYLTE